MKLEYLDKLAAALQTHAPDETILICASRAEGRRMLSAVAAQGYILVGVRAETLFSLAQELCAPWLALPGTPRFLDETEGAEYVRSCLDRSSGIYSCVNAKTLMATKAFFRTFQELAMAGFAPDNLRSHPALTQYPKLAELQTLWNEYVNLKRARGTQDRADLFNMALHAVNAPANAPLRRAHYVVLGDFAPSMLERKLLDKLTSSKNLSIVDLPCAKDLSARDLDTEGQYLPTGVLREQLPRVDVLNMLQAADSRFVACRGIETEVQFPLRDILTQKLPLEECTIVYLNNSYAQSLYEEAGRFHLPVTVGGGLPLIGSQLYTTLKQVEHLPLSDFNAEDICTLLESGCCTPKWPVSLAERMRRKKVGWGRERYELAYEYEEEEIGKPKALTTEAWKVLLEDWKTFLTLLLAAAQPVGTLEQQRADMLVFLDYCYHLSASEAAACAKAKKLTGHIIALEENETLLHRLLRLMETSSYLGGGAEPGKLYITPLSQAACTNRKHLYILGFSRYALQGSQKESPILLDKERKVLGGLTTSIQKGREHEFRLLTLMVRHGGNFVLTYPDFTSDGMLSQEPAPFFRDAAGDQVEHVTYLPNTVCLPTDNLLQYEWVDMQKPLPREIGAVEPAELQPKKTRRQVLEELTYSATSLENALHCPYGFYLKYVMHVRAPQPIKRNDEQWLDSMTIGTFCHAVLENYYKLSDGTDWEPIFEEEYNRLKRDVPMPQPHLEATEKAQLHTIVARAVAWTKEKGRKVLKTEASFLQPLTFGNWTIKVQGSIDRVDQLSDGSLAVLDYKTGNPDNYKNDMYRHWQHYLYTMAEEQQQADQNITRAGYLFLREDAELVELEETDELRELTEKRIEWLLDRISAEDYIPECAPGFKEVTENPDYPDLPPDEPWILEPAGIGSDTSRCRNCEFEEICPVRKGGKRA